MRRILRQCSILLVARRPMCVRRCCRSASVNGAVLGTRPFAALTPSHVKGWCSTWGPQLIPSLAGISLASSPFQWHTTSCKGSVVSFRDGSHVCGSFNALAMEATRCKRGSRCGPDLSSVGEMCFTPAFTLYSKAGSWSRCRPVTASKGCQCKSRKVAFGMGSAGRRSLRLTCSVFF